MSVKPNTEMMERMWQIAPAFIAGAPYAARLGMKFVSVDVGKATLSLPFNVDNIGDPETQVIHGGVITSLLDQACGLAVMAAIAGQDEGGQGKSNKSGSVLSGLATLDLRIDYLRPARSGETVIASANCYKVTHHVAFVRGVAHDGDEDDPLATCQATFMIKTGKLPPPKDKPMKGETVK